MAWTGANEFELYRLNDMELLQVFKGMATTAHFPRHVVFGENDNAVVGGTDAGCALVFDIGSPDVVQKLNYPEGGLVQQVAVSTV